MTPFRLLPKVTLYFNAWKEAQDGIDIFYDLSKAFGCASHEILRLKHEHNRLGKTDLNFGGSAGL